MMRIRVDLPNLQAEQANLGAGKKGERDVFQDLTLGGTILPTRFIVKTYWAICGFVVLSWRFEAGFGRAGFMSLPGSPWIQYATMRFRSAREVTTLYSMNMAVCGVCRPCHPLSV